jgi:ABC-type branched-subunit amino acid transport system substrate-binding protein
MLTRPLAFAASLMMSAAAFAQSAPGVTATEIRIGQTMPYSGPASGYSAQGRVQSAYYTMINAKGGINGRKLNFLSYDDGYSPPKTVEQTRKLVEQDEVLATFGQLGTPTNSAIHKYMNQKKVPQLFISTGADKWNDPKNFPFTIPLYPSYTMEAKVAARYLLETKPDAKIGVLYQNDDFGKDYLKGLKAGLGDKAASLIIKEVPYEVGDPTLDSQMVTLKNSGADVFFCITVPKFGAQAIKKAAEIGWRPLFYIVSVSSHIKTALEPAGLDNSKGLISALAFKIPSDPRWADAPDVKDYFAFLKEWSPNSEPNDGSVSIGYGSAWLTAKVLERAGSDLSRENIMKVVTSIKDEQLPLGLPGVTVTITPDDYAGYSKLQISRFDGKTWEPVGPVMSAEPPKAR